MTPRQASELFLLQVTAVSEANPHAAVPRGVGAQVAALADSGLAISSEKIAVRNQGKALTLNRDTLGMGRGAS